MHPCSVLASVLRPMLAVLDRACHHCCCCMCMQGFDVVLSDMLQFTSGVNDVELSLELANTAMNVATGHYYDEYGEAYAQQVGFRHSGYLRPGGNLVMKVYEVRRCWCAGSTVLAGVLHQSCCRVSTYSDMLGTELLCTLRSLSCSGLKLASDAPGCDALFKAVLLSDVCGCCGGCTAGRWDARVHQTDAEVLQKGGPDEGGGLTLHVKGVLCHRPGPERALALAELLCVASA